MLRLLQDICSTSGELPSKYWLPGISANWRNYIARGGEATIYKGTMGEKNIVVREISKPGEADWASPAGESVIKVLSTSVMSKLCIEWSAKVDQTGDNSALSTSTSPYHSTPGDIPRICRGAPHDDNAIHGEGVRSSLLTFCQMWGFRLCKNCEPLIVVCNLGLNYILSAQAKR
jgi:hypothetical protein